MRVRHSLRRKTRARKNKARKTYRQRGGLTPAEERAAEIIEKGYGFNGQGSGQPTPPSGYITKEECVKYPRKKWVDGEGCVNKGFFEW